MYNKEVIELALKNKSQHLKTFLKDLSIEELEDIFQNILLNLLSTDKNIDINNSKAYINTSMKNAIIHHKEKNSKFIKNQITTDETILDLFEAIPNEICYYNEIENYQDNQYNLKIMKNNIEKLFPKQKEAVIMFLNGKAGTNTPNFKQAMKTLRNIMGGKVFKIKPIKKRNERCGAVGRLSRENILDIRQNVKIGKDGNLTKIGFYAKKYHTTRNHIRKIAKNELYKHVE